LGSESRTIGLLVSPAIDPKKKKKSHLKITIFRGKFAYILVGFGLDKHNSHPDKGYTTNCTHDRISVFESAEHPQNTPTSGASDNNGGGSSLPLPVGESEPEDHGFMVTQSVKECLDKPRQTPSIFAFVGLL